MNVVMDQQVILPENVKVMIRDIESRIHRGELMQGHKIPSIRELMRTYKTSLGSTKRGLNLLCERGILVTRPGAGVFVNSIPSYTISQAEATIMVFLEWSIEQTGIYNIVFEGIRKRAMQEKCSIRFSYLGLDCFSEDEVKKLAGDADGIIMLAEYDRKGNDFSLGVPAVGVCWQKTVDSISIVDLDPFIAADLAVKFFEDNNEDEVCVISAPHPNKLIRADSFSNAWRRKGKKSTLIISSGKSDEDVNLEPDKAYLFTSSWLLDKFSNTFKNEYGVELSERATVIGIDGRNIFDPNGHKSASIYPNWQEVGVRALDECLDRIKSPGRVPAKIYLPCNFYEKP